MLKKIFASANQLMADGRGSKTEQLSPSRWSERTSTASPPTAFTSGSRGSTLTPMRRTSAPDINGQRVSIMTHVITVRLDMLA
jgi:hypothetical protein